MRSLARALLVLNVGYCLLALAVPGLPGWRMFEGVEDVRHTLRDRDGKPVDIRVWLPRGANLVDRSELRLVVEWVCKKERDRAPFHYEEHATGFAADVGSDCKVGHAR